MNDNFLANEMKSLTSVEEKRKLALIFSTNNVFKPLVEAGYSFLCLHKNNAVIFTSRTHANEIKAMFPAFSIRYDERKTPIAELIISYE